MVIRRMAAAQTIMVPVPDARQHLELAEHQQTLQIEKKINNEECVLGGTLPCFQLNPIRNVITWHEIRIRTLESSLSLTFCLMTTTVRSKVCRRHTTLHPHVSAE